MTCLNFAFPENSDIISKIFIKQSKFKNTLPCINTAKYLMPLFFPLSSVAYFTVMTAV